jgi:AcrR family transcriptional regulator
VSTKKQATRERLLEAAWKRLERGDPAKLDDVGADVGVSRQAVYLHFGSRGGLLLALVGYMDERLGLGERLAEVMACEEAVQQLEAAQALTADYQPKIHGVAMALLQLSESDEEVRAALEDRMQQRRHSLAVIVDQLASQGRLGPEWSASEMVDALWEAGAPSSYQHLVVERGWKLERFRDWLIWQARSFLRK